jgi:hypothetical protein
MSRQFGFDRMGIGKLLHQGKLAVPLNQRPYAWREGEVEDLFHDLSEAFNADATDYFLGTIVLIHEDRNAVPQIADGQQRLATTTILLARIRDKLSALHREQRARSIDMNYLREIDMETEELMPRLALNVEDHEFFTKAILPAPYDPEAQAVKASRPSNTRLQKASDLAGKFVDSLVGPLREDAHADLLVRWVRFIDSTVTVVVVTVPDEVDAFRIFETLNDRGLRAGQTDLIKNYLLSRSLNRLPEAHRFWSHINGSIESLGTDDDERLLTFIRHFWITRNGPTKVRDLADAIRRELTGETKVLNFLSQASDAVNDYVALWSKSHPKWAAYKATTREYLGTIGDVLQVEQIRPLLFAVARHFEPAEAEKAFRLFVSWSVRFLIFGGRGGMLDQQYSLRAFEVGTGRIKKARELREAMERYVPSDREFEEAFATARVSRAHLARYYLRALDKTLKGDPHPEYIANEDESTINLEHVLPVGPSPGWSMDPEERAIAERMLGNMVLMRATKNRDLGNGAFAAKRKAYASSSYAITSEVAQYKKWTLEQIRERQRELAKIAVRTWSLRLED